MDNISTIVVLAPQSKIPLNLSLSYNLLCNEFYRRLYQLEIIKDHIDILDWNNIHEQICYRINFELEIIRSKIDRTWNRILEHLNGTPIHLMTYRI